VALVAAALLAFSQSMHSASATFFARLPGHVGKINAANKGRNWPQAKNVAPLHRMHRNGFSRTWLSFGALAEGCTDFRHIDNRQGMDGVQFSAFKRHGGAAGERRDL
jgi:hypothetical protein